MSSTATSAMRVANELGGVEKVMATGGAGTDMNVVAANCETITESCMEDLLRNLSSTKTTGKVLMFNLTFLLFSF